MTTKGLPIGQVVDAFVSVPSAAATMLGYTPIAPYTTTSTSFVDVDTLVTGRFVAPVTGTYLLDLQINMIFTDTSSTG